MKEQLLYILAFKVEPLIKVGLADDVWLAAPQCTAGSPLN